MDRNHKLEAPHNESLKNIEQLDTRSELSGLYFQAKDQWSGELLSDDERQQRRDTSLDAITRNIKKRFVPIGLLGMLPFALLMALVALALTVSDIIATDRKATILIVPVMLAALIWFYAAYRLFRHYFAIFYEHALRGSMFLFFQLALTGAATHVLFVLFIAPLAFSGAVNLLIAAGIGVAISPVISFVLLHLWLSTRISGNAKLSVIFMLIVALGASSLIPLF